MTADAGNIESLINEYQSLDLSAIIDFDKFNQYSIVHHSTTIKGSTLTERFNSLQKWKRLKQPGCHP